MRKFILKVPGNYYLKTKHVCKFLFVRFFFLCLERLAMALSQTPDNRPFWSKHERFINQFKNGDEVTFTSNSKYPPCYKDISFWLPEGFEENDFFELARGIACDLVEQIEMIDTLTNPKSGKTSNCYRTTYRSMDRSLTDDEINKLQDDLRDQARSDPQGRVEMSTHEGQTHLRF
eukprot:FR735692.1.p1 GENE.FR735692.1~~FR735692.1.p1  ORF type:complete len:175 (+),score=22.17 FR735692.1:72-596(+)